MQTIDSQTLLEKYKGVGENKPKNTPIPFEVLRDLYLDAFSRTGWQSGLMARPEVQKAEDRLNEVWIEAMEGKTTLDDFKRTLTGWEAVISNAMTQKEAVNG